MYLCTYVPHLCMHLPRPCPPHLNRNLAPKSQILDPSTKYMYVHTYTHTLVSDREFHCMDPTTRFIYYAPTCVTGLTPTERGPQRVRPTCGRVATPLAAWASGRVSYVYIEVGDMPGGVGLEIFAAGIVLGMILWTIASVPRSWGGTDHTGVGGCSCF
jgi:hypothetical protein